MKKTIGILLGCLCILLLESGVKRIEKKPALTITPCNYLSINIQIHIR